MDEVAVFWDYENCPVPSGTSGYSVVDRILSVARPYGSVKSFKAYLELCDQTQKSLALRSELQSSGVSLIDCPHNGRKDVADKMIIVDMLAHAIDTPSPSTLLLITGDRDFAYAVSILRHRRYHVVLATQSNAHLSLKKQAAVCLEWPNLLSGSLEVSKNVKYQPKEQEFLTILEIRSESTQICPDKRLELQVRNDEGNKDLQALQTTPDDKYALFQQDSPKHYLEIKKEDSSPSDLASTRLPRGDTACSNGFVEIPAVEETNETAISTTLTDVSSRVDPVLDSRSDSHPTVLEQGTSHISNFVDDDKPQPPVQFHKEPFAQPLLDPLVYQDECIRDQTRPTPSPVLFLPSILTGSSSRNQFGKPKKLVAEVLQPLTVSPVVQFSTGKVEPNTLASITRTAATPTLVSHPTLAPPITVTSSPQMLPPIKLPNSSPERILSRSGAFSSADSSASSMLGGKANEIQTSSEAVVSEPQGPVSEVYWLDSTSPAIPASDTSGLAPHFSQEATLGTESNSSQEGRTAISTVLPVDSSASPCPSTPHKLQNSADRSSAASTFSFPFDVTVQDIEANNHCAHAAPPPNVPDIPEWNPPAESSTNPLTPSCTMKTPPRLSPEAQGGLSSHGIVRSVSTAFIPLIRCLQEHKSRYTLRPLQVNVAKELAECDTTTYIKAGVASFQAYFDLAREGGLVTLGGGQEDAWISLNPDWHHTTCFKANDYSFSSSTPALSGLTPDATALLASALPQKPCQSYSTIARTDFPDHQDSVVPPLVVPDAFKILVQCLQGYRSKGITRPCRTNVAMELNKSKATYVKAGVARFGPYTILAEAHGIVELGHDSDGEAWIALKPEWHHAPVSIP